MLRSAQLALLTCATILLASSAQGLPPSPSPTPPPADAGLLSLVIGQVKDAIVDYQNNRGTGPFQLPPLSSVDFDFKTVSTITEGITINLFIFKLGGSHANDVTNDVTFTYSLPKPQPPPGLAGASKPPQLKSALAQAIQSAANALKTAPGLTPLDFSKLTIMIQYGVTWGGSLGIGVPVSFVVLGANADVKSNTIQAVKLTFAKP